MFQAFLHNLHNPKSQKKLANAISHKRVTVSGKICVKFGEAAF